MKNLHDPLLMFSSRVPSDLAPNAITQALAELRARGAAVTDLTETNPTRVGITYPDRLLDALADPRGLLYDPQPFGLRNAREAVAADYARRGVTVPPDHVVLTASSSESYALLFKLLCDPGDTVLVPTPSYPLFEHLASLENVEARPYRLEFHGRWIVDADDVAQGVDDRTRAILVVSPNNPTGSILQRTERASLQRLCAERGLALIGDEVFADYGADAGSAHPGSVIENADALTVSLGGLSKSIGLPQVKLGWMAFAGQNDLVRRALERLELICDTYLSVGTPVQVALPALLSAGASVRRQLAERIRGNLESLRAQATAHPACRVLPVEGGWTAIVQVPATMSDDARVLAVLRDARVLVHPGYFFDFAREGYLVISLLPAPADFAGGIARMFETMSRG